MFHAPDNIDSIAACPASRLEFFNNLGQEQTIWLSDPNGGEIFPRTVRIECNSDRFDGYLEGTRQKNLIGLAWPAGYVSLATVGRYWEWDYHST